MTDAAAPTVRFYYNSAQPLALASELLAKLHIAREHMIHLCIVWSKDCLIICA